jgi:heme exporter protein B
MGAAMSRYLRNVRTLLGKEIKTEWRERELAITLVVFAMIILIIFNFAFDLERNVSPGSLSGMLWVTLAFTGTLGFTHGFGREKDRGSLTGLLLAPVDRSALLLAKLLMNWIVMVIVASVLLPVSWILFDSGPFAWLQLLVVLLGTLGYAVSGTIISALVLHSRTRALLMPGLLLPVSVPLFLSAVKASEKVISGAGMGETAFSLELLAGYVVIFLVAGVLLADIMFEE